MTHVRQIQNVLTPGVSANVEEDGLTANAVEGVTIARWKMEKLSALQVDYLTEICNVYVKTHERNHLVVLIMIAGLTVESAELVTSTESVSAREITLLVIEDVRFVKENQSATRFVAYQVSVLNRRFVNHQLENVFLSVRVNGT